MKIVPPPKTGPSRTRGRARPTPKRRQSASAIRGGLAVLARRLGAVRRALQEDFKAATPTERPKIVTALVSVARAETHAFSNLRTALVAEVLEERVSALEKLFQRRKSREVAQ